MRRAARVDANHAEIVYALLAVGCTVRSLAPLGKGAPDILVGVQGRNLLFEIKDGAKVPSARKLTEDEAEFHAGWRGQVAVIESVDDALKAIR